MKVLLITTTYPTPARPRQGAFNQLLVEALGAHHDVRVIAPVPWTQLVVGANHSADWPRTLHPTYFYPPKILREHYHRFYWQSIRSSLKRLERVFTPDVVLGYWLHPDSAVAVHVANRLRVPSIAMSGGTDLRLLPQQRRRRLAITRVLKHADRLIVFSRELADQAHRLGVPREKVDIVYRGVKRECFYPTDRPAARSACGVPANSVVIFWAGRFEQVKNPAMLLYAAVRWKQRWGDRLRVILAGDGPLRSQLHQLRRQLDLQDAVLLTGNLTQGELALRYNAADVTVLTSHSEGIPNVLLESIACGTPFVATDVGGVSEIASPEIDRLVGDGDTNQLADAVIAQIESSTTAPRDFVPIDLPGMADKLNAVMARVTTREQTPQPNSTLSLQPASNVPVFSQTYHEVTR